MKYLHQILLILLFSFLGEVLHALLPWPIPASIYGMLLLFAALSMKIIRVEQVKDGGSFLVSFLPVLFVPPIVSLLDCWNQLKSHLIPIVPILIGSTVLCFAVSGRITQWYVGRKEKKHD
jgi:holin-like protein